jgi:hypothetical protein
MICLYLGLSETRAFPDLAISDLTVRIVGNLLVTVNNYVELYEMRLQKRLFPSNSSCLVWIKAMFRGLLLEKYIVTTF